MSEASPAIASGRSRPPRWRRRVLLAAGALLAVSLGVLVSLLAISSVSDGEVSVLIGTLDSDRLAVLAITAAFASLAAGLCAVPLPRVWLLLLIPARFVAIAACCLAAFVGWLTSSTTVVPLVHDGCDTGYVVQEDSFLLGSRGTVYRADGILFTAVERTGGDDGYRPFADGAYIVTDESGSLRVWYAYARVHDAPPVSSDGEPDFTLPMLTDWEPTCGMDTGSGTSRPTPTAVHPLPPEYDLAAVRAGLDAMVDVSLDAAVGPVLDENGHELGRDGGAAATVACTQQEERLELVLAFQTADNAASLARILEGWDAAGYSADRAIQEDLRYSETLPIAWMSIRDTTTIDGLIHLRIRTQCIPSG